MSSAEIYQNIYSPPCPGDKESTKEPQHTQELPSPSKTNEKSENQKRSACFKCGIPILLVLLCIVGVGVTLHHYGTFPRTPGTWNHCMKLSIFLPYNSYQKEYESISMNILFLLQTMMLLSFKLRKDSHLPFIMKMLRMWRFAPSNRLTNRQCFVETSRGLPWYRM